MINFVGMSGSLEISVHIHESTVSVNFFELGLGVKASGRDPLECQNFGGLTKHDQI